MSKIITFCEGTDCPLKELCSRYTDRPTKGRNHRLISVFTETPGRYYEYDNGRKYWICNKKL